MTATTSANGLALPKKYRFVVSPVFGERGKAVEVELQERSFLGWHDKLWSPEKHLMRVYWARVDDPDKVIKAMYWLWGSYVSEFYAEPDKFKKFYGKYPPKEIR